MLVLLGGVLAYLAVWWEAAPQARFLLPGARSACRGRRRRRVTPWLRSGGVRRAAVLAILAGPARPSSARRLGRPDTAIDTVTVGAEERGVFLERLTGTYRALVAACARAGPGTIGVVGYDSLYNLPGRAIQIDAARVCSLARAARIRGPPPLTRRQNVACGQQCRAVPTTRSRPRLLDQDRCLPRALCDVPLARPKRSVRPRPLLPRRWHDESRASTSRSLRGSR